MRNRRKFIRSASLIAASAGAMGYQASHASASIRSVGSTTSKSGLQHTVFFWMKDSVSNSDKKNFEKGLKKFFGAVKEIDRAEIGIPASTPDRDVVDKSFDYSIFVSFKSMEDHDVYQAHEAHKVFIDDFSPLWAKVVVYDSAIQ